MIEFDIDKEDFRYFQYGRKGNRKYYKHLTDDMKRALVKRADELGSVYELLCVISRNKEIDGLVKSMNKSTDAFKLVNGFNDEPIPKYVRDYYTTIEVVDFHNMTLVQEMLHFVYCMDRKDVKEFGLTTKF